MGEKKNDTSEKISKSLTGKFGELSRRWKGDSASYVAKHIWILKHYGNASRCENKDCKFKSPKRYEWANISGLYKRDRSDYKMLCPSCHRRMDYGDKCKRGHLFDEENTRITKEGWRSCRKCQAWHQQKIKNNK